MKFDYWFLQIIRTYFVVPKLCQKTFYWKLKKNIIEVKDFQEHTWCKIEMSNKTFLHMLCLYRSPSSSSENNKLLSELILNISLIWGKLLVPRDFNYPTINWDNLSTPNLSNFCTFKFLAATQDALLFQYVQNHTHTGLNQKPTLIDLFFSQDDQTIANMTTSASLGESHYKSLPKVIKL